jgi:hypothetical protein
VNYRAPPTPTEERAQQTEALIREGGTDVDRWAKMDSLATQWDARAAMAADWMPGNVRVVDVGCGAMALGGVLKPGCTYFPADVVERRPSAFVVDLNKKEFPPGEYDWITFLGVLEYIHEIEWPIQRAREAAPNMIVTYCTHIGGDVLIRRGMGWVNELTQPQFETMLEKNGWKILRKQEVKRGPTNIQMMFACERV